MGPVAERLAGTMHVKLKTENKNVSLITRKPKTRTYAVSAVAWSCGCVVGFRWMVVRFVCVIRVPVCPRAPCVPCVRVPAPLGVFLSGNKKAQNKNV